MRMRALTAMVTASIVLAACSGGGAGSPAIPSPSGTTAPRQPSATASFVVKIPARVQSSAKRTPKYLTADVQGIEFDVSQNQGAVPAGSVFYAIGPSEPYCTTPSGGGLTCTLAVQALPGDDTFVVKTFDQPNNQFDADIISTGSVEATISAQQSNTVNIVTSGIPTSFIMSVDNQYPSVAGTQAVHLLALDADMNVIAGPYDTPVTLQNSNDTGATPLSATSVSSSTEASALTFTWDGSPVTSWVTLTAQSNSPLGGMYNYTTPGRILLYPGSGGVLASPTYLVFANPHDTAKTIALSGVGGAAAPFVANTATDGFNDFGVIVNNDENPTFIRGCAGIVTVSGSSPSFTVTPVHTGVCNLKIADSTGGYYGTVPVVVQSL